MYDWILKISMYKNPKIFQHTCKTVNVWNAFEFLIEVQNSVTIFVIKVLELLAQENVKFSKEQVSEMVNLLKCEMELEEKEKQEGKEKQKQAEEAQVWSGQKNNECLKARLLFFSLLDA